MAVIGKHIRAATLKRLAKLQMLARHAVEGVSSGLHRSPHKGVSVLFKQHRQYVPGDEIRRLDWKVYGKSDKFFIREYEEETNVRATILLDKSGSMGYRGSTATMTKFEYAKQVASALGFLMLGQQDMVGMVTFDEKIREYVPPRSKPSHLSAIIETLEQTETSDRTNLADVFKTLVPKIHRRGILFIISDFFADVPSLIRALSQFKHRRHDIALLQIWDRDELEFPFGNRTRFECLEVAGEHQMVDPAHLRASYLANVARFREELKQGCFRNRIDLVPMVTDEEPGDVLAKYLAMRKGR